VNFCCGLEHISLYKWKTQYLTRWTEIWKSRLV